MPAAVVTTYFAIPRLTGHPSASIISLRGDKDGGYWDI
jgi:hypothetical protein